MFEMPASGALVMVGPGTGIVPFIGFLETFESKPYPDTTHLYFGCRRDNSDYIFKDALTTAISSGLLSNLNVAFSRPTEG